MSTHTYRIILVGFAILAGATAGAQTTDTTSGATTDATTSTTMSSGPTANTGTGTGTADTNPNSGALKVAPKTDADIAAILDAVNSAELDAARLAQAQGTKAEVKSFAKMMIDEHSKNDSQSDALVKRLKITPKENADSKDLRSQAQAKIDDIKNKTGADFDRAYIDSQVMMHSQVANDLRTSLIPAAKNSEFKSFLQSTLNHVQTHLVQAQKLQASMSGSTMPPAGQGTGTGTMKK